MTVDEFLESLDINGDILVSKKQLRKYIQDCRVWEREAKKWRSKYETLSILVSTYKPQCKKYDKVNLSA